MHVHKSHLIAGLLYFAAAVTPSVAAAQAGAEDPSNTRGFFLNLRSGGYGVSFEGDRDGTGTGLGARLGYGLSERVTLFAGFEGGMITEGDGFPGLPDGDDHGLLYMDLGTRVHFRTQGRLVPFAEGSLNVVGLWFDDSQNDEVLYGGLSASLGGGLLWFVTPSVALETSALFGAGELMEAEIGGVTQDADIGVAGVRLQVGLSLYPNR